MPSYYMQVVVIDLTPEVNYFTPVNIFNLCNHQPKRWRQFDDPFQARLYATEQQKLDRSREQLLLYFNQLLDFVELLHNLARFERAFQASLGRVAYQNQYDTYHLAHDHSAPMTRPRAYASRPTPSNPTRSSSVRPAPAPRPETVQSLPGNAKLPEDVKLDKQPDGSIAPVIFDPITQETITANEFACVPVGPIDENRFQLYKKEDHLHHVQSNGRSNGTFRDMNSGAEVNINDVFFISATDLKKHLEQKAVLAANPSTSPVQHAAVDQQLHQVRATARAR